MIVYRETEEIVATISLQVFIFTATASELFGENTAAPFLPNGFSLNGTTIDISTLDSSFVSFGAVVDENGDNVL